jgi:glutamate N-acetyltransferase/amino-acid N-acetyltransferase
MVDAAATSLGIDRDLVIIASTGPIGEPFPTELVVKGIEETVPKLSKEPGAGSFAANAILTTDTIAKEGFSRFKLDGKTINIAGIAKGSGMIHPNMATMLAFVVTDAAITPEVLQQATSECVDQTFNLITVDGDTSTNDSVIVLANGMADNPTIESTEDPDYKIFRHHLEDMMAHLAKLIVADGEGASKFIEYRVTGAPDDDSARRVVRSISNSTLVKTAMYGRDPNWGRIICAAGNAGVDLDYQTMDLFLGNEDTMVQVLEKGRPLEWDRAAVKKVLRDSHIRVELDMHSGNGECMAWGTDLSTDYVVFNSVYTT